MRTPRDAGFWQPAEWDLHRAVWLAWPAHRELWEERLPDVQREFVELCRAIADVDPESGRPRGEGLRILVRSPAEESVARAALQGLGAQFYAIGYGDIWLRDTAPVFLLDHRGELGSVRFAFNGWGGKYLLPGDRELAEAIQTRLGNADPFSSRLVAEGGALEIDGEGTLLTTKQCLLSPERQHLTAHEIEEELGVMLGVQKVLWIEEGLLNDHTDGHIDTIVRFVAPGVVVCMEPSVDDDPNAEILNAIARQLESMTDAKGRKLAVHKIPSPGRILDEEGEIMPASYVNFYIANTTVVVPTYGSPYDQRAVASLAPLFPNRKVIGSSARAILAGGGAFHCITQQQPQGAKS